MVNKAQRSFVSKNTVEKVVFVLYIRFLFLGYGGKTKLGGHGWITALKIKFLNLNLKNHCRGTTGQQNRRTLNHYP